MKRKLIVITATLALFVVAYAMRESSNREPVGSREIDDQQELSATEERPLPRLLDLGSDQCIPCKKMAPILEELTETYRDRIIVEFIDVWKNPEASKEYGVRVIPTQIFFDASGEERFRHEGFMSREAILAKWSELGIELRTPPPMRVL